MNAMLEAPKAHSHSEVLMQDTEEELEALRVREDETSIETKNKTEEVMEEQMEGDRGRCKG